MRDFQRFVREQLSAVVLPPAQEPKIVEELAAQIEESYDSYIASGLSDEQARQEIHRQIPDWKTIGDALLDADPIVKLAWAGGDAGRVFHGPSDRRRRVAGGLSQSARRRRRF